MARASTFSKPAALLAAIVAIALPSAAEGAPLQAKVASVTDGDSVRLRFGDRTRAFGLAGLDAPEGTACYAASAKAKLKRLLPKGARVTGQTSGRKAQLRRGGKNVNRAMVRGGFARAVGSTFSAEQAAAKRSGVGLWKACQSPPGPPGDTTGQPAIDRMTAELQNGRWRSFTSGSNSSTEYIFNLCSDSTWLFTGQSNFGGVVFAAGQPWRVTDGFIQADGSFRGAIVEGTVTNADPPRESPTFRVRLQVRVTDGAEQWYWDGDAAQYFPNAANCTG